MAESHVFSLVGAFLAPGTCRCFWMLQRPGRLSCRMCPWNPQGSRALNYRLQQLHTADLQLAAICCRTNVAGERARLVLRWWRWDRIIRKTDTEANSTWPPPPPLCLPVLPQSSPSGCGCAEEAWRFSPAAAWVTCSGNGTRTTSQKATLSPTSSEWVEKEKKKKLTSCLLHRVITPAKKKINKKKPFTDCQEG